MLADSTDFVHLPNLAKFDAKKPKNVSVVGSNPVQNDRFSTCFDQMAKVQLYTLIVKKSTEPSAELLILCKCFHASGSAMSYFLLQKTKTLQSITRSARFRRMGAR